jgi:hypothetical protein
MGIPSDMADEDDEDGLVVEQSPRAARFFAATSS